MGIGSANGNYCPNNAARCVHGIPNELGAIQSSPHACSALTNHAARRLIKCIAPTRGNSYEPRGPCSNAPAFLAAATSPPLTPRGLSCSYHCKSACLLLAYSPLPRVVWCFVAIFFVAVSVVLNCPTQIFSGRFLLACVSIKVCCYRCSLF